MSGMNIVTKMILAAIVVVAAASGLDVVDVVMIAEDATDTARGYAQRVELDGDETALFDEQIDPETGEVIIAEQFARPIRQIGPNSAIAFADEDGSTTDEATPG